MTSELKQAIATFKRIEKAWTAEDKNSDDYLAAVCFYENMSYRLFETAKHDRLIGFRIIMRLYKRIFEHSNDAIRKLEEQGDTIIVGGIIKTRENVIEYIQRSSRANIHSYIAKDFIPQLKRGKRKFMLALLPFALRQAFRCVTDFKRLNVALSIYEVAEIAFILHYIREHRIKHVYDFVPYEKDGNLMSLVLKQEGITITKIPSSGPLATHNRILLGDEIICSTPYHYEEQKKFRDSLRAQTFTLWPPERAFLYFDRYTTHPTPQAYTLGFYSHGDWLRREEKHSEHGRKVGEAEQAILKYLSNFVAEYPQYKLIVFPHPREKKKEISEKSLQFYTKAIGNSNFEMMNENVGTAYNFERVDIAVAAFSTILYERLFCGYKTLIGNIGLSDFPMNGSTLNNICFGDYEEMKKLIELYGAHDEDFYFNHSDLDDYRYTHYPKP
ncbi:MAG: hypothetical protein ACKVOR_13520 [Flavobacteriales bacterium]